MNSGRQTPNDSSRSGDVTPRRGAGVSHGLPISRTPTPSRASQASRASADHQLQNSAIIGSERTSQETVQVYGVPMYANTVERALEDATTVRDSTEYGGELDFKQEPAKSSIQYNMDDDTMIEVVWDGRDPEDKRSMSKIRKWLVAVLLCITVLQISLSASVWQQSSDKIQHEFKVRSARVTELGITLYMAGLAIGTLFASLSEYWGRKLVYLLAFIIYIALQLLTIFGTNVLSLVLGRAFTGFGGGVIITLAYGTIGDLFDQEKMGGSMVLLAIGQCIGPTLAPIISANVSESVSFQWVFVIMIIWSAVMALLVLTVIPETYGPVLLAKKAKRVRKTTNNPNFYAPLDKERRFIRLFKALGRPIIMMFSDGVMFFLCFYAALLSGILYSFFTAFPVVFEQVYQWKRQMQGISFLGIAAGMIVACFTKPLWVRIYQKLTENSHGQDEAEYWMPELFVGSLFVSAGLFMFGWTSMQKISPVVCIVGVGVFGFGTLLSLTSIFLYIVDGYRKYAVSGVAACQFLCGVFAAVFPMFAGDLMYKHVGVHWSPTIFGIITICCCPMPIVLFVHGTVWRDKSPYSCNNTLY